MASSKVSPKQKKGARLIRFFKSSWSELKKVSWPRKNEMVTYTTVVVIAVLIVAGVIWIFDSVFAFLLSFVL